MLALHGMRNERNERRKALILGLIIAAAVLALGLWESAQGLTPNH